MSYLDTARQVMAEMHGCETATKATEATKAPLLSHMSLMSHGCVDETALQARCMIACNGLPILGSAIFESLTPDDRAAQYTGEEGPEVLRAYAVAIASRLKAGERKARTEGVADGAVEFRFKLAWNPETWHHLILPAGSTLADARRILKGKHHEALLWTEIVNKPIEPTP